MKQLFEEVNLGGLLFKNRILRSSTYEQGGADENGNLTPLYNEIYEKLAQGGTAGIITGQMASGNTGLLGKHMARPLSASFIQRFSGVVAMVHSYGCKLIVQLNHAGAKGIANTGDTLPKAPSSIEFSPGKSAQALDVNEILQLAKDFGESAAACQKTGADAVQIHAAHGYLISEFLSPVTNQRSDEYGGSIENRARILFLVYDEIRARVGEAYPIWVKINASDLTTPATSWDDFAWLCRQLEKRGVAAIEASGGLGNTPAASSVQPVAPGQGEGYFAALALKLADEVSLPVISVAGHRNPATLQKLLNQGNIQAFSLCRPLIRQPNLPALWQAGSMENAACISCSKCFNPANPFGCPLVAAASTH